MNADILDLSRRVVFFPVRHHSPTGALLVRKLVLEMRPAAVLIEGPSDFNERMAELFLPHTLPIAIYTYFRNDKMQRGAFYPFCLYSPEWQAGQTGYTSGSRVAFIDMPWREMARIDSRQHRYADAELREGNFLQIACKRLGLEGFNELWDDLIEARADLSLTEYMRRCHHLCYQMRHSRRAVDYEDIAREEFMAKTILGWMDRHDGRILVVTGGFHSHALFERIHGIYQEEERAQAKGPGSKSAAGSQGAGSGEKVDTGELDGDDSDGAEVENGGGEPDNEDDDHDEDDDERGQNEAPLEVSQATEFGIALTPYSYERLDSLTGYDAGMPSPGFYHHVFADRSAPSPIDTHRRILFDAAGALRKKKQPVSSADLIAVETSALALARLRGHEHVWRTDLIDGIMSALVKDELISGVVHPMLEALYEVFRGDLRGKLALGTILPPLVHDIQNELEKEGLRPTVAVSKIELDLTANAGLSKSRLMHRLHCLQISGFALLYATDLGGDDDGKIFEDWSIQWTPHFDATCIESAVYGATLLEAASNRLLADAKGQTDSAEQAADLLARACSMGIKELSETLAAQMEMIIRRDQRFQSVANCAARLLFLYKYDELLADKPLVALGQQLRTAFDRSIWLLETLGNETDNPIGCVKAIGYLVEIIEKCGAQLDLDQTYMIEVFSRARKDSGQAAIIRGALTGALWVMNLTNLNEIIDDLTFFADPQHLGDFLTGLFHLGREVIQRNPQLISRLDNLVMAYDDEQFLEAVPSMRQAFAYFSPREKHEIASAILQSTTGSTSSSFQILAPLSVDIRVAARALHIEARAKRAGREFGIREVEP